MQQAPSAADARAPVAGRTSESAAAHKAACQPAHGARYVYDRRRPELGTLHRVVREARALESESAAAINGAWYATPAPIAPVIMTAPHSGEGSRRASGEARTGEATGRPG